MYDFNLLAESVISMNDSPLWSAKTPVVEYTYATDRFIIQGGKILRQTFVGKQ